jgi:hypothetical protein
MCRKSGFPDFADPHLPTDPGTSCFDCVTGTRIVWISIFEYGKNTFGTK